MYKGDSMIGFGGLMELLWVLTVEVVIRLYTYVKIRKSVHPTQINFTVVNCKINEPRHFRIQQSQFYP